jgi:5-methylcytosine-specific restriction protein A
MGRKDDMSGRRGEQIHTFWEMPPSDQDQEKRRARELRHTAWWRQKISRGECYYCGAKVRPDELTMDHIIPLSRGGLSEKINIVPSCKECNNQKRYLLPSEWEEYLVKLKGSGDSGVIGDIESEKME